MAQKSIGIIMNGVTGRMGYRQHLVRSILAIREQGGVELPDGDRVQVEPILVGRNEAKLARARRAARHRATTPPTSTRRSPTRAVEIYSDFLVTKARAAAIRKAIAAGKHDLHREAHRGDASTRPSSWPSSPGPPASRTASCTTSSTCPGLQKLKRLIDSRLLRPHPVGARRVRLLGLRGRLAAGAAPELELPRRRRRRHRRRHVPALELRAGEPLRPGRVGVRPGRHPHPERWDENGEPYTATADDAAYGIFELEGGVDRPDQLLLDRPRQPRRAGGVPGRRHARLAPSPGCSTAGSSTATPPRSRCGTPTCRRPTTTRDQWQEVPDNDGSTTASRPSGSSSSATSSRTRRTEFDFLAGARGVQLAEAGLQSSAEGRRVALPEIAL